MNLDDIISILSLDDDGGPRSGLSMSERHCSVLKQLRTLTDPSVPVNYFPNLRTLPGCEREQIVRDMPAILGEIVERESAATRRLIARLHEDIQELVSIPDMEDVPSALHVVDTPHVAQIAGQSGMIPPPVNFREVRCIISDMTVFSPNGAYVDDFKTMHDSKLSSALSLYRECSHASLVLIYDVMYDCSRLHERILGLAGSRQECRIRVIAQTGRYRMMVMDHAEDAGTSERGDTLSVEYHDECFVDVVERSVDRYNAVPRLYYLAHVDGGGRNPLYEKAERILIDYGVYACHVDPAARLMKSESRGGWGSRKSYSDPYLVRTDCSLCPGTFGEGVKGPCVIVSLDTLTSFPYWEEEIPFMLDHDQVAVVVRDPRMGVERLSRRMNEKLPRIFASIRSDRKLTPTGRRIRLTSDESEYILLNCWKAFEKRLTGFKAGDNRFGYSDDVYEAIQQSMPYIDSYMERLVSEGYLEHGSGGRYICRMNKTCAALVAMMISSELGLYEQKYTEVVDDIKTFSFDQDSQKVFTLEGSLCSCFFDDKLSLPPDTIRKVKSYALHSFQREGFMALRKERRGRDDSDPLSPREEGIRMKYLQLQDIIVDVTRSFKSAGR